mgnify:CR=1 FL=1
MSERFLNCSVLNVLEVKKMKEIENWLRNNIFLTIVAFLILGILLCSLVNYLFFPSCSVEDKPEIPPEYKQEWKANSTFIVRCGEKRCDVYEVIE